MNTNGDGNMDSDTETKIATMQSVLELSEGDPVTLWDIGGKTVIRAYNDYGNNYTDIDLNDLIAWVSHNKPSLLTNRQYHNSTMFKSNNDVDF
jgi:hypothetical protein